MDIEKKEHLRLSDRVKELELENQKLRELVKQSELDNIQMINENQSFIKAITDNMPGHIASVDANTLRYQFVNQAFQESFNKPVSEIVGSHIKDIIGEANYKFALKYIEIVRTSQSVSYENVFTLTSGKRWIKVNYVPDFDDYGNVASIIVLSYDITEKKQAEIDLKKSENDLRIANATKDKFFSIIAHDLKNPLNTIHGFSELLLSNLYAYDLDKIAEFLGMINSSSKKVYALIENLLEWSRAQTGQIVYKPEKLELEEIVLEVVNFSTNSLKSKSIDFKHSIPEKQTVFADKNMLSTILRNLVTNAVKFTKEFGKIEILATETNKKVIVTVADTGIGMTDEVKNNLFEIYEKITTAGTKEEKGTGLGLILCKEFIEKHGGEIWVESELGKGSRFNFSLFSEKQDDKA
jgi:PAS domain S-box-containing protein